MYLNRNIELIIKTLFTIQIIILYNIKKKIHMKGQFRNYQNRKNFKKYQHNIPTLPKLTLKII